MRSKKFYVNEFENACRVIDNQDKRYEELLRERNEFSETISVLNSEIASLKQLLRNVVRVL